MSQPALVIRGLVIRDGHGATVVAGVDLEVEAGGTLVLIGETGSGKSLIAQAVMGLLPLGFTASGAIAINGHAPVDAGQAGLLRLFWSRETMLLPQEPRAALDPTMRIGRQLFERTRAFSSEVDIGSREENAIKQRGRVFPRFGDTRKYSRRGDAAAVLQAVGLAPEVAQAYPMTLSGGMAQRVLVASVLVGRAPLLIADEPTKGLDPERLDQTRDLLLSLRQAGRALMVITHDIALARALGGRLVVLREGRVVEQGESAAIFAAPRQPYTRAWIEADPSRWRPSLRCCAVDALVLAGHGLRFGFRGRPALFEGLDIHVPRGGVLALTGPSGCGKTTLGNILLGLQAPGAGQVSWAGVDPYRDRAALKRLRRRYQKLHQDPASVFLPSRGIGLQLADLTEVVPELDLALDLPPLLERLRLDPRLLHRRPGEISGGEAQRLALARILLMKPELIVADEPTSRLDPLVQRETIALLREVVAGEGVGIVLIGHDRALLAATADDVITIGR